MRAGAAKGERAVDVPLDPVTQVEHAVHRLCWHFVRLDMRALVGFGSKRTTRRVTCMADQLPELPWVRGVWDGWTHGTFLGLLVLR
jgi:hypothetical protein